MTNSTRFYLLLLGLIIYSGCNNKVKQSLIVSSDHIDLYQLDSVDKRYISTCYDPLNYAPFPDFTRFFEKRTIRVNFHFPDDSSRLNNFIRDEASEYVWLLIENANMRLNQNEQMNLPEGNSTAKLPAHYQYLKVASKSFPEHYGLYFETDNELAYFINKGRDRNNYDKTIIKYYAIDSDTVLNAFLMPHHPDSLKSRTYKAYGSGIALGSSIKLAGLYQLGGEAWAYATLFNHEVGHVYSLSHAWHSDGCDDTPNNSNCFSSTGVPPCDGITSNNMMDYNNSQMAITPCQLGKIHQKMADTLAFQRRLVIPTWCKLNTDEQIVIDTVVNWLGARDASKNIVINEGGHLTVCCRLHLPKGGKITVHPGGKLTLVDVVLHNDCGDQWAGIEVLSKGSKKGVVEKYGKVHIFDVLKTEKEILE